MSERDDQQLLREFLTARSEDAFAALARRHSSLVYGVALRKLSDRALAEEVTQNVFVVLAKKAPFLCHHQNLAGWLHKTALLECRQQIRSNWRRKRREEMVMQLNDSASADSSLASELDDALLELSEKDRQPLLLRFFESMSLREVAGALSIREDAAQKRVAKSLSLLERILKRRGREVTSAALAGLLAGAVEAAPAHVAVIATEAAVAAGGSMSGWAWLFARFMAATKPQAAAVCALVVAAPLLLQTQNLHAARAQQRQLDQAFGMMAQRDAEQTLRITRFENSLLALQGQRRSFATQTVANPQTPGASGKDEAALYRWSDTVDYVRLPKSLLEDLGLTSTKPNPQLEALTRYGVSTNSLARLLPNLRIPPLDTQGNFSAPTAEALGLSEDERAALQGSLHHFSQQASALIDQHTVVTNAPPPGPRMSGHGGKIYALIMRPFPEEGAQLRQQLEAEFEMAIGPERAKALLKQARSELSGLSNDFGQEEQWIAVARTSDGMFNVVRARTKDGASLGGSNSTVPLEYLPVSLHRFKAALTAPSVQAYE